MISKNWRVPILSLMGFLSSATIAYSTEYVPGEIIVKLKHHESTLQASAFIGRAVTMRGMNLKKSFSGMNMHHMKLKPGQNLDETLNQLSADPEVEFAEPNYIIHAQGFGIEGQAMSIGDVQMLSATSQTSAPVQLQNAWNALSSNKAAPIVAVVDTGIDFSHSVFTQTGAIYNNSKETINSMDDDGNGYIDDIHGWNFVANNNNPQDDEGHGTHCSGIVLGTSQDIRAASLTTAKIQIMPLKFLDSTGSGSTADAVNAINYAVANGAKVISNSWGGSSPSNSLLNAIAYAYNNKVVFVAAAGNNGTNNDSAPTYPANYSVPNVISVAATSDSDILASFSNYGATTVNLASPGVSILSTYIGNTFAYESGTSMATPFVSGLAALMIRENPNMSAYQVRNLLLGAADKVSNLNNKVSTGARIDFYTAVSQAKTVIASAAQPSYDVSALSARDSASTSSGGCGRVQDINEPIWHSMGDPKNGGGLNLGVLLIIAVVTSPVVVVIAMRRAKTGRHNRKHDRYLINSQVRLKLGEKELVGQVSTISLGGLQLNTDAMLEKGGVVTMMISSPDGQSQVKVDGRIVWSEEQKHYGVQFANAENTALQSISDWTKGLLKAS